MKLEPHLPQLPSIGELLDHPRVKGIVDRINRSTIAQRATGFLEELKTSLAERTGVEVPSVAHLAERLARRLLGESTADGPLINATGVVVGDLQFAPALSEAAVHAMLQLAGEYHQREPAILQSAERKLCRLAGAEAATVVGNYAGVAAIATAIAAEKKCQVDAEPLAGFLDPSAYGLPALSTIAARIASGADLVVADGSGLIGGPACGIVVGRRALVELATQRAHAAFQLIGSLQAAALHATVAAYVDDQAESAMFHVPVWQLLSAPLANLQQRAERLAPLVAVNGKIALAEPRQIESAWRRGSDAQAPSWAVAVCTTAGDGKALLARLRQGAHPVIASERGGEVLLDLRAVFPRWDQQLVAAIDAAVG